MNLVQKLEQTLGLLYQRSIMRIVSSFFLLNFVLLTGCAHNYVLTLNNGRQIGSKTKPELKNGAYYFKNALGQETSVPAGRVSQIETQSSAQRGGKPGFIGSPSN